jgi:hypothetical protein
MLILYIKHKDYGKVADDMGQKYGYDIRWSFHSVRTKLRDFLQAALDKLISSIPHPNTQNIFKQYFTQQRRDLLQENSEPELKIKLYSFFLEKKTTTLKVIDLINTLREFFEIFDGEATQASLPKLEQSELSAFGIDSSLAPFDISTNAVKKE